MFKNYLKIATRNLIKKKGFTALNLLGLSIGISSVLLVSLYLHHEGSYDTVQPDAERVYRLVNKYRDQTYTCMSFRDYYSSDFQTQMVLVNHLKRYDEVEEACHFVPSHSAIGPNQDYFVYVGDKKLVMSDFLYTNTGKEFQSIFPQTFLQGSPSTAFSDFDRLVLTASTASKLYGKGWSDVSLIGNTVQIQDRTYVLGGVIEDVPGNVHYDFSLLVYQEKIPSWGAYTYFKLDAQAAISSTMLRINNEVDLIYPGRSDDELQKGIAHVPLTQIHFTEGMLYELKPAANEVYLITFGLAGLVILLIIWTNYTNLSMVMYAGRQREIGVRKLMGARAKDVQLQILVEAILLTLLCFPVAWSVVYFGMPPFNQLMDVQISTDVLFNPSVFLLLVMILVFTGLISGLYPAVVFSRKSLVGLFREKLNTTRSNRLFNFRNALLTAQFFMLIGLMSITFIIKRQMDYVQSRELGFEKEGVLFFDVRGAQKFRELKSELSKIPEVKEVGTGMVPGSEMYNQLTYKMKDTEEVLADGTHIYTSLGSLKVLGFQSEAFKLLETQDSVLVINQTAANKLAALKGVEPEELVGETLISEPEWENEQFGNGQHYTIAAIIEDFDYFSLRYPSQSLLIEVRKNPGWAYNALVKIESDRWLETIPKIESAYAAMEPDYPFDFTFLDDHLTRLYTKERNAGILASALTGICILLAVMGLIGVVGFVTLGRQKEIGIRKVFGASLMDILITLNKSYFLMIIIATLVAVPVSVYLGSQWLDNFAYRIKPDFWMVLLGGGATLLIVLLVAISQSMKSASMNPADSLRNE